MRDLVFKNLTSQDMRKKVLCSSEVADKSGIHSVIRRHLICLVKEVDECPAEQPKNSMYVLKERNTRENRDRFTFRMKGTVYTTVGEKKFMIYFMHSLRITLTATKQKAVSCKEK